MKEIVVAGGCFWGVEEYYRRLKGIGETKVGYVNGLKDDISYEEVCSQKYQAIEAVQIQYDESVITLENIMNHLFRIIDPTSLDKQGNDIGMSYRVGAYYDNDDDKKTIELYVNNQKDKYEKEIVFEIKPLDSFVKAEDYHQDYLVNNPTGYCHVDFSKIKASELK